MGMSPFVSLGFREFIIGNTFSKNFTFLDFIITLISAFCSLNIMPFCSQNMMNSIKNYFPLLSLLRDFIFLPI